MSGFCISKHGMEGEGDTFVYRASKAGGTPGNEDVGAARILGDLQMMGRERERDVKERKEKRSWSRGSVYLCQRRKQEGQVCTRRLDMAILDEKTKPGCLLRNGRREPRDRSAETIDH